MRLPVVRIVTLLSVLAGTPARADVIPQVDGAAYRPAGAGWDSTNRRFTGHSCVKGTLQYAGAQQATLQLDRSLSADEFNTLLSAELGGGINLGLVGASISTRLTSIVERDGLSETVIYRVSYQGKDGHLVDQSLSPDGEQVAALGDPAYTKAYCGDEFVDRVHYGASLYFFVRYDFRNEHVRNEFVTKIKVRVLMFSKTKTITKITDEVDRNTFISFGALQVGGDPSRLQAALASVDQTQCTLEGLAGCQKMVDTLMTYATDDGQFPAQARESVLSYTTKGYHAAQHYRLYPDPQPVVDAAVKDELERLDQVYLALNMDQARGETLLEKGHLEDAHRIALDDLLANTIRPDLNLVRDGVLRCHKQTLRCLDILRDVNARLVLDYDRTLLRKERTFVDFCLSRATDQAAGAGIEKTLRALGTTDCDRGEERLALARSLDLGGLGIESLDFLRGADALETLDAHDNKLSQVASLSKLTNLRWLNLRDNQIRSATGLSLLPRLAHLDLAHNALTHDHYFEGMTALRELFLNGNLIEDFPTVARLHLDTAVLDDDGACEYARAAALKRGHIGAPEYELYKDLNFAPVYEREGDPASIQWGACIAVADRL